MTSTRRCLRPSPRTPARLYTVTLAAAGDAGDNSAFDKAFFKLGFSGPEASELHKVVIDLSAAGEQFDPNL